jgi:hypothetical protein
VIDLVLIQGLPGGPYQLHITEACNGDRSFSASEMCTCPVDGDAPHWHRVLDDRPCLTDLFTDLLTRYLQGVSS